NYIGYAIPARLLATYKRKKVARFEDATFFPSISFIVAAYNEQDCMREKILNSLAQQYPPDKVEFLFITDGSTDQTNDIIREYPQITLIFQPERNGKSAALNRVVSHAKNDILIFSDANTVLNPETCFRIAGHYASPKVGGVAGEKKVLTVGGETAANTEGAYWKYESALKKIDAEFYSVVGAAGELFSLRRDLYEPLPHTIILDDFVLSLRVAAKGFRIVYEPDAFASELPSFSMGDEQKRKIRIAAGGFQAICLLGSLWQFWKHPRLTYLYVSHRVLRWACSPFCLVTALVSNFIICLLGGTIFYKILLVLQLGFYGAAFLGATSVGKGFKPFKLIYYFVFMNISVIQGFIRFLKGRQ
ncbi:MAG: glycosyltransferase family 2 protein, partial [Pedobacter sp.]